MTFEETKITDEKISSFMKQLNCRTISELRNKIEEIKTLISENEQLKARLKLLHNL